MVSACTKDCNVLDNVPNTAAWICYGMHYNRIYFKKRQSFSHDFFSNHYIQVFGLGPGVVDGTRSSFKIYHGILLVLALFLSIPSAFCTRDAPETAPSASAVAPHENFAQGMRKLLGGGSRAYFVLLVAGGVNVGILNCFTALISDLLGPYGYSQADAGNVGIVNVGMLSKRQRLLMHLMQLMHEFYY